LLFYTFQFCRFGDSVWCVFTVTCRADWVYEKFHEKIYTFAAVAECIDLSFVGKDDAMSLPCYCVLYFYVIFLKILDNFRLFLIFSITVT